MCRRRRTPIRMSAISTIRVQADPAASRSGRLRHARRRRKESTERCRSWRNARESRWSPFTAPPRRPALLRQFVITATSIAAMMLTNGTKPAPTPMQGLSARSTACCVVVHLHDCHPVPGCDRDADGAPSIMHWSARSCGRRRSPRPTSVRSSALRAWASLGRPRHDREPHLRH